MPNRILMAEGWEKRIQDKLGVDPAYLPNEVIQQPECITVAEANIIEQVPDYSSLTGDNKVYLEAAVVCECANLLALSMPVRLPKKESGPHETHELEVDWKKRKAEFEAERDGYIGKILDASSPTLLHFTVTEPRRW